MPGRARSGFTVQVGQKIGRGVVVDADIRVTTSHGYNQPGAQLLCDCGTVYEVALGGLKPKPRTGKPNNSSCGCARRAASRENIKGVRGYVAPKTHGLSNHPLYNTWNLILQRCENPEFHKYQRYGGRGIKVCERWHDVRLFVEDIARDLGPRPDGHTLNRKDNDGNYEPGNVEWANARKQAVNKQKQGTSQFWGVHWEQKKQTWLARLHLGTFKTEEEAAVAYRRAVGVLEREGLLS